MHPGLRRFSVVLSILVAASLAPGAAADEPLDPTPAELRLVLVDLCDTAPELRHGTLRGIQELLEPVGIRVTSRTAFPGEDHASGGVYVVLLPFDPSRPRTQPVGGVARREYGRQLTVWAFPPWVAGGLGLDLGQASRWSTRERLQFQRAMAVVVVHELVHALARVPHAPHGLMSGKLRREQLLEPHFVVDTALHRALLAGVASVSAR